MGAQKRVNRYEFPPMQGCKLESRTCIFSMTPADFAAYRQQAIQNCTAENSGGFLQSKNRTQGVCQAKFDELTANFQGQNYDDNKQTTDTIKEVAFGKGGGINNTLLMGLGGVFILIIIWAFFF